MDGRYLAGPAVKFGKTPHSVEVNVATRSGLFQTIRSKFAATSGFCLAAYRAHDLIVADGRPVVWLSRIARQPVELMPGSDMILPLCWLCAEMEIPIALMGSSDAALAGAASALTKQIPTLKIVYAHAPPLGFDPQGPEADAILAQLSQSGAGLCFVALGAPKQEIFAARGRSQRGWIFYRAINSARPW